MRFISWNLDSLNAALTGKSNRAELSRNVLQSIVEYDADVIAIQETKLPETGPTKKHQELLAEWFPEYKYVWNSSKEPARKSYAGTMFLYKNKYEPIVTMPELDAPSTMDLEGRIITLEFDEFFVTQVYTPNAGRALDRLEERMDWDEKYRKYIVELDKEKPVILTGDFNVAHKEIDLKNPDTNRESAGFTDEERRGFTSLLDSGFVDTFRHIHGDVEGEYTWWTQIVKTSKVNNSGWRIDYFLVSESIKEQVLRSEMIDSFERQDHTPILLDMDW